MGRRRLSVRRSTADVAAVVEVTADQIVEDFKVYAETGQLSERKREAVARQSRKRVA